MCGVTAILVLKKSKSQTNKHKNIFFVNCIITVQKQCKDIQPNFFFDLRWWCFCDRQTNKQTDRVDSRPNQPRGPIRWICLHAFYNSSSSLFILHLRSLSFKMPCCIDTVLLCCTGLHSSDLHWTVRFSQKLHPTELQRF